MTRRSAGTHTAREVTAWQARPPAPRAGTSVCLVVALLTAGAAGAAPASDQRGFVADGIAGGLYFQRCEAGGPAATQVLLKDQSPGGLLMAGLSEVRRSMSDADRPVYVEFRGTFVAGASGQGATVQQFYRAIGHVDACSAAPPMVSGVRLLAEGTQPAWRLQATPAGTRLEQVGRKPVVFSVAKLAPVKLNAATTTTTATATATAVKARTYLAAAPTGGQPLKIDITEQACNDTAAESAFGARVVAQWGEQRLEGCAARF
ncbi:MAG: hypothetical protein AD742_01075 [Methylibium sp. NZG]|nr:MAG: hypothetical protein AD742_01075 [Methylibium sp. NZG]